MNIIFDGALQHPELNFLIIINIMFLNDVLFSSLLVQNCL